MKAKIFAVLFLIIFTLPCFANITASPHADEVDCQSLSLSFTPSEEVTNTSCSLYVPTDNPLQNIRHESMTVKGPHYVLNLFYSKADRNTYIQDVRFEDVIKELGINERTKDYNQKQLTTGEIYQSFGRGQCLIFLSKMHLKGPGYKDILEGLYCREDKSKAFTESETRLLIEKIVLK